MKRNYYPSKSSLARRTRDDINGTIGPGNPVILPSGITRVQVIRKRSKLHKAKDFQSAKDRDWQGSVKSGSPAARNGWQPHRPEHKQDYKRRKNRPGKVADLQEVTTLKASLLKPAKGPLRKHTKANAHIDWSPMH